MDLEQSFYKSWKEGLKSFALSLPSTASVRPLTYLSVFFERVSVLCERALYRSESRSQPTRTTLLCISQHLPQSNSIPKPSTFSYAVLSLAFKGIPQLPRFLQLTKHLTLISHCHCTFMSTLLIPQFLKMKPWMVIFCEFLGLDTYPQVLQLLSVAKNLALI